MNACQLERKCERGTLSTRETQAAEFRRDWERLLSSMPGYEPHLTENEVLALPSTAHDVAFRIFGPTLARQIQAEWAVDGVPAATLTDKEGVVGVALDAYFGCLEDGRKQLAIKWENWEALETSAPQRAAAARDFFVRECRQEVSLLEKLRKE
jgi:hypothetical protein